MSFKNKSQLEHNSQSALRVSQNKPIRLGGRSLIETDSGRLGFSFN